MKKIKVLILGLVCIIAFCSCNKTEGLSDTTEKTAVINQDKAIKTKFTDLAFENYLRIALDKPDDNLTKRDLEPIK